MNSLKPGVQVKRNYINQDKTELLLCYWLLYILHLASCLLYLMSSSLYYIIISCLSLCTILLVCHETRWIHYILLLSQSPSKICLLQLFEPKISPISILSFLCYCLCLNCDLVYRMEHLPFSLCSQVCESVRSLWSVYILNLLLFIRYCFYCLSPVMIANNSLS